MAQLIHASTIVRRVGAAAGRRRGRISGFAAAGEIPSFEGRTVSHRTIALQGVFRRGLPPLVDVDLATDHAHPRQSQRAVLVVSAARSGTEHRLVEADAPLRVRVFVMPMDDGGTPSRAVALHSHDPSIHIWPERRETDPGLPLM